MGYGLLSLMYPDMAYDLCERIAGALTAYACGDALGLPWESAPRTSSAIAGRSSSCLAREGWPRGSTTDDTALTLLAARHLAERDGGCDASGFLADLAAQEPAIRGLGPTTTAAIEQFRRSGKFAPSADRATNGAAMRALPVGWVLPHAQANRRRELAIEISRATHAAPAALVAACVIATCASWALEGADPALLLEVAVDEAREAAQAAETDTRLAEMLTQVSEETWTAPAGGISLDPHETVTAVLSCVAQASITSRRPGERGSARGRYRHRSRPRRRPAGLPPDPRAGARRVALAPARCLARAGKRDHGDGGGSGDPPCRPVGIAIGSHHMINPQ